MVFDPTRICSPLDPLRRCAFGGLLALGICSNAAHGGEIYRCVGANGAVSYTNIACPADTDAQHVASYEPQPNAPVQPYALASDSEDLDARIARETERARELGYRQAQADLAQAAAQQVPVDDGQYLPIYLPVAPFGARRGGDHDDSHHHRHPGGRGNGTPAHVARSPNNLPLSTIPFYRSH